MRSRFPGYYRRTEEELSRIWDDGIFVLDANVLLNLYRYSEKTRNELLGVLRRIEDHLWIPYQVADEFHSNRQSVIEAQRSAYSAVKKSLSDARKDVEQKMGEMHSDPGIIEAKDLRAQVEESFRELINEAERLQSEAAIQSIQPTNSLDDDEIWRAVVEIVGNKVGDGLSADRMQEVLDTGPRRYESRVPPGYRDDKKPGDDKFGDVVLWFETIDKAKETNKPVLFVTDDRKDDWWLEVGKADVPRPELGNEIHGEAGVLFHMLLPLTFLNWAGKRLDQKISEEAAEEIEGLRPLEEQALLRSEDDLAAAPFGGPQEWIGNLLRELHRVQGERYRFEERFRDLWNREPRSETEIDSLSRERMAVRNMLDYLIRTEGEIRDILAQEASPDVVKGQGFIE